MDSKFYSFVDDDTSEGTGFKFGEVTVVCNPEYYPNVLYKKSSCEIIILPVNEGKEQPFLIKISKFLVVASWWLVVCTYYSEPLPKRKWSFFK